MRFCLSSKLKRLETLMKTTVCDAFSVTVEISMLPFSTFHIGNETFQKTSMKTTVYDALFRHRLNMLAFSTVHIRNGTFLKRSTFETVFEILRF